MKLTEEKAKEIIEIFSNPRINKNIKIKFLMLITNNGIEMLLAKIYGKLED